MSDQFILVAAFITWDGKALITQRSATDDFLPGNWDVPGGKVDFGENPVEALFREVREEVGFPILPERPYYVTHEIMKSGRQAIEIAFHCSPIGEPKIVLSHEHDAFRWITKEEVNGISPMTDFMRGIVQKGFETL